jgi:hypothetical protein
MTEYTALKQKVDCSISAPQRTLGINQHLKSSSRCHECSNLVSQRQDKASLATAKGAAVKGAVSEAKSRPPT